MHPSSQLLPGAVQVLMEVLMGKRCELKMAEGAYWRSLSGEQSPSDLETALQMVHSLFTTAVTPVPSELATCMQCASTSPATRTRPPSRSERCLGHASGRLLLSWLPRGAFASRPACMLIPRQRVLSRPGCCSCVCC